MDEIIDNTPDYEKKKLAELNEKLGIKEDKPKKKAKKESEE